MACAIGVNFGKRLFLEVFVHSAQALYSGGLHLGRIPHLWSFHSHIYFDIFLCNIFHFAFSEAWPHVYSHLFSYFFPLNLTLLYLISHLEANMHQAFSIIEWLLTKSLWLKELIDLSHPSWCTDYHKGYWPQTERVSENLYLLWSGNIWIVKDLETRKNKGDHK